jgi:hypothetical protein
MPVVNEACQDDRFLIWHKSPRFYQNKGNSARIAIGIKFQVS